MLVYQVAPLERPGLKVAGQKRVLGIQESARLVVAALTQCLGGAARQGGHKLELVGDVVVGLVVQLVDLKAEGAVGLANVGGLLLKDQALVCLGVDRLPRGGKGLARTDEQRHAVVVDPVRLLLGVVGSPRAKGLGALLHGVVALSVGDLVEHALGCQGVEPGVLGHLAQDPAHEHVRCALELKVRAFLLGVHGVGPFYGEARRRLCSAPPGPYTSKRSKPYSIWGFGLM